MILLSRSRRFRMLVLLATLPLAGLTLAQSANPAGSKPPESAGPYVPTPWVIVDEIMKLAQVGPGDFVVDLGSGDGRLVITAAQKYSARGGFGVDIEPTLVDLANATARKEGVGERVRFHVRDLFATQVGEASVVTLYLLPSSVPKLEPKLLRRASGRGARRLARLCVPELAARASGPDGSAGEGCDFGHAEHDALPLYVVPARIAGRWS